VLASGPLTVAGGLSSAKILPKPGPSPGIRRRGAETTKGGIFFKYNIGCMQQPGAKHEMGSTDFKWGEGTTGDGPVANLNL